jgi:hypothetical protein
MSLLTLDPGQAREHFHRAPFKLGHTLSSHPLFSLPRLIELARAMPRDKVEYNSGKLSPGVRPEDVPGLDMPPSEVIRRIEHHNAWMVIKNVEEDPEYRRLLHAFLAEVAAASGNAQRFGELQGFIFVSSAHATTPFHIDAEENILVQIKGDKFVHVFDNRDRALVGEEAMEISPAKHRNQLYEDWYEQRAKVFTLSEGAAVHIPYMWPHWVRTGGRYSISIAMTWKTPEVKRLNKIRLVNGSLRTYGFPQEPPGARPLLDALKVLGHDAARLAIDPLRKSEALRRWLRGAVYGREANYYYREAKTGT